MIEQCSCFPKTNCVLPKAEVGRRDPVPISSTRILVLVLLALARYEGAITAGSTVVLRYFVSQ